MDTFIGQLCGKVFKMKRTLSVSIAVSTSMIAAVCWSEAFRCVLTHCQVGKTSAVLVEKQLLVRSPSFYSEKDYSQVEDLLRRGRPSEFTPRSHCAMENRISARATPQTLHTSLSTALLATQLEKGCTGMAPLGGLQGQSLFSLPQIRSVKLPLNKLRLLERSVSADETS